MKVKSESEVAQSCPTLSDPMDCSLPGSSVHGIFQEGVLEWGAIAFSRWAVLFNLHVACVCVCVCVVSRFSSFQLCATLWSVAHQASLPMGFCRREYWSGLPCPPPGDLPNPGIKPESLMSPALAGRFFTTRATREAYM